METRAEKSTAKQKRKDEKKKEKRTYERRNKSQREGKSNKQKNPNKQKQPNTSGRWKPQWWREEVAQLIHTSWEGDLSRESKRGTRTQPVR